MVGAVAAPSPRTPGNQSRRFPLSEKPNPGRGSRGKFPPGRRPEAEKGRQRVLERWKGTQSPLQAIGAPLRYGGLRAATAPTIFYHVI